MRERVVADAAVVQACDVDVLVGAIPSTRKVGGSLNQALIAAAGAELDEFIVENIYKPRAGDVFEVPPFNLPAPHVFFAVTPDWKIVLEREDRDLVRCYRAAMQMAENRGLKKIAFPALGTGKRQYPVRRAARLAIQGIMDRMTDHFDEVRIICNRRDQYDAFAGWLKHYGHDAFL